MNFIKDMEQLNMLLTKYMLLDLFSIQMDCDDMMVIKADERLGPLYIPLQFLISHTPKLQTALDEDWSKWLTEGVLLLSDATTTPEILSILKSVDTANYEPAYFGDVFNFFIALFMLIVKWLKTKGVSAAVNTYAGINNLNKYVDLENLCSVSLYIPDDVIECYNYSGPARFEELIKELRVDSKWWLLKNLAPKDLFNLVFDCINIPEFLQYVGTRDAQFTGSGVVDYRVIFDLLRLKYNLFVSEANRSRALETVHTQLLGLFLEVAVQEVA